VTRAPRGEARRALILEAALRVVGEVGPDALTHRRVAEAAGVPLAATTYWFASKGELLAEAYRLAAQRDIDRVEALADSVVAGGVAPAEVAPLLARLAAAEVARGRTGVIAAYALWIEAARRPELRGIERGWTAAYVGAVERILAAAGAPRPALDARIVVAALDGLLLEQVAMDEPGYASDVLEPALGRLVAALFATHEPA
jgi:DNA-binding transcriptional regulator YbjK